MKKYIIFKSFNDYKITDIKNYNSYTMDNRKVITLKECYCLQDAKNTVKHYLHLQDNQIVFGSV